MSINYHCNQYEQPYTAKRMQSWELPKDNARFPGRFEGFSRVRANDRGHLLPKVPRGRDPPFGRFVSTWNLPNNIPGNRIGVPTGRVQECREKLLSHEDEAREIMCGNTKPTKIPSAQELFIDSDAEMQACRERRTELQRQQHPPEYSSGETGLKRLTPPVFPMNHPVDWPRQAAAHRWDYQEGQTADPYLNPSMKEVACDIPECAQAKKCYNVNVSNNPDDTGANNNNQAGYTNNQAGYSPAQPQSPGAEHYLNQNQNTSIRSPNGAPQNLQQANGDLNWPMARSAEPPRTPQGPQGNYGSQNRLRSPLTKSPMARSPMPRSPLANQAGGVPRSPLANQGAGTQSCVPQSPPAPKSPGVEWPIAKSPTLNKSPQMAMA